MVGVFREVGLRMSEKQQRGQGGRQTSKGDGAVVWVGMCRALDFVHEMGNHSGFVGVKRNG